MAARPTRWLEHGAAAARPSLLGRVAGVTVRYGSFGRFRVRRTPEPVMPKLSAGVLLYRRAGEGVEVLVAHPGGPIWARRDTGAWSLPKGAPLDTELDLLETARREFEEETGHEPPAGPTIDLGEVRMRSGKVVHAWAIEGDLDPATAHSNEFEIEWPPRSGKRQRIPEIDRVEWFGPIEARRRIKPTQAPLIDRLEEALGR